MRSDPHFLVLAFNAVITLAVIAFAVARGVRNGRRKRWKRFSAVGLAWCLHAGLFFVAALACGGSAGDCRLPLGLDFTDWSAFLYTHGIATLFVYVRSE